MVDPETIKAYDANVDTYAKMVEGGKPGKALQSFMNLLDPKAFVLDLGCGPANSSAMLRDAGFEVDPVDASPEMVSIAKNRYDLNVRLATFDDLTEIDRYDGVWANFSLLHAPRDKFSSYIRAIHDALVIGGVFHIGMKTGGGEKRDRLGRFYTFYSVPELTEYLTKNGFRIVSKSEGEEAGLAGSIDPWVTLLAIKDK